MTMNIIFWAISHLDICANSILKLKNFENFTLGGPLERKMSRDDHFKEYKAFTARLWSSGVKNKRRKGQKMSVGGSR
jgi:hypothetical protein